MASIPTSSLSTLSKIRFWFNIFLGSFVDCGGMREKRIETLIFSEMARCGIWSRWLGGGNERHTSMKLLPIRHLSIEHPGFRRWPCRHDQCKDIARALMSVVRPKRAWDTRHCGRHMQLWFRCMPHAVISLPDRCLKKWRMAVITSSQGFLNLKYLF